MSVCNTVRSWRREEKWFAEKQREERERDRVRDPTPHVLGTYGGQFKIEMKRVVLQHRQRFITASACIYIYT